MDMQENVAVPKFASFRPKQKALGVHDVDRGTTPDNSHDQGSRWRPRLTPLEESSHHRQKGKKGHHGQQERHRHHHRRHRSQSRDRTGTESVKKPDIDPEIVAWDDSPEVYAIDTKGDPKNLVYGAIHQYSLPTYYRSGAGNVLGLDKESKISRELSGEKGIVIQSRYSDTPRSREKYAFARNERKGTKKLRIKSFDKEDAAFEATLSFIPLRLTRGLRQERLETGNSSSSENDGHHYRSIEGKAKAESHPEDKDLEFASESSASDYERTESMWDKTIRQRNTELSQRVEADPTNVDAWLELVDYQDKLIRDKQGRRKHTSAERLSTADIKLSMYENALKVVGEFRGRERLFMGLMEEGSKIWE
jgi:NRDE-2, necessary for RNA interference